MSEESQESGFRISRRQLLISAAAAAVVGGGIGMHINRIMNQKATAFIGKATDYSADLKTLILSGLSELGIGGKEIKEKRVLLKPNLVESGPGIHRTTHPAVIQAAAAAFLSLGAKEVLVAEGSGHTTDTLRVLDETGTSDMLVHAGLKFIDLNYDDVFTIPNTSRVSALKSLTLPLTLKKMDWIVSLPKMKTHHWVGMTAAMKNLFGVMPGSYYGWPKNVLHFNGIPNMILDINHAVRPNLAIVDGIVGMEGDGPIMGDPHPAGILVMSRSMVAADDTCARIMGLNPAKIEYLHAAKTLTGLISEDTIGQLGEKIGYVRSDFKLLEDLVPAHRGLRATDRS